MTTSFSPALDGEVDILEDMQVAEVLAEPL